VAVMFQATDVEEMLALMGQWGITELQLTVADASLSVVRAPAPTTESIPLPTCTANDIALLSDIDDDPVTITAPVVGVFHPAKRGFPAGSPQVGDQVQAGQLVGTIELMHVPTDLISPVSGLIEGILIDNGAGVEYGQSLIAIRPFEEVSEDEAGMLPPPAR